MNSQSRFQKETGLRQLLAALAVRKATVPNCWIPAARVFQRSGGPLPGKKGTPTNRDKGFNK
jgi:hypothetical protein